MRGEQHIPVPLGGGVDRQVHEYVQNPPTARTLENMHVRSTGALTRRPGWTTLDTVPSGAGGSVLVARDADLALFNSSGGHYLKDGAFQTQAVGGLIPTTVIRHKVYPATGWVQDLNIAHSGGYTAIIFTEVRNSTLAVTDILVPIHNEAASEGVCVILDSDWRVIFTQRYQELGHLPRVEGITDATTAAPAFIFFGLQDTTQDGTSYGLGAASLDLNAVYVDTSILGTPSPYNIGDCLLHAGLSGENRKIIYDTHAVSTESEAYVAYYENSTTLLRLSQVSDALAGYVEVGSSNLNQDSMAVWRDATSDTILVYGQSLAKLYYTSSSLSGLSSVSQSFTASEDFPVFYLEGSLLYQNNFPITLAGSAPATPTYGSEVAGYVRPVDRRPQPYQSTTLFISRGDVTSNLWSDRLISGGEEVRRISGDDFVTVIHPSWSDLPAVSSDTFHKRSSSGLPGVVGQSALSSNALLIPQIVVSKSWLPDPYFAGHSQPFDRTLPILIWDTEGAGTAGQTAVMDSAFQIVISEIVLDAAVYSSLDHYGTCIVAAGALYAWDGQTAQEATLLPPIAASADNDLTGTPGDLTYQSQATIAGSFYGLETTTTAFLKGVLVWLDANGVKYRSDAFSLGAIENTSDTSTITVAPRFNITLHPTHYSMLQANRLALEVYGCEADNGGVENSATDPDTYSLIFRGPVLDDGSTAAYVDGANMVKPSLAVVETPLYTASGELGASRPPASQVMTRAGNYLFLLPAEDAYTIWHTKPLDAYIGPEFHPTLTISLPPESGGAVSLAGEADRLLVLCANATYELFVANGPDALGTGAFPSLRRLWLGDGCVTHMGTVSGTFGTFFVAKSGPKLLPASGGILDVSKGVTGLFDVDSVLRAVYNNQNQEIWLFQSDADTLILDVRNAAWSVSTLQATAVTDYQRHLARIRSTTLLEQDTNATQDGSTNFAAKYQSPWLKFEDPMGFKRIREIGVLVNYVSGKGKIIIELEYDYITGVVDTFTFTNTTISALDLKGQLRVKPTRQKCDAIRITIRDSEIDDGDPQTVDINTLSWSLASVELAVAAKRGIVKLQQEAKA